jgi:hypothetical protein
VIPIQYKIHPVIMEGNVGLHLTHALALMRMPLFNSHVSACDDVTVQRSTENRIPTMRVRLRGICEIYLVLVCLSFSPQSVTRD